MGFLSDKLRTRFGEHEIEVRADNDLLKGLIYKLFVDGEELAEAQNFLKIPGERTLEADVILDGESRRLVLQVRQRMLNTDFSLRVDDVEVPLETIQ